MKSKIKGFVFGMIMGLTLVATIALASSGLITKQLSYHNIKIELDGKEIVPKDANGNYVEPFTIDGTTYLPVRAVSGALGLNVDWDDKTNTVILSTTPIKPSDDQQMTANERAVWEYVEENRSIIEEMFVENEAFSVSIEADGTAVVYKYTFKTVYTDEQQSALSEAFKEQEQSNKDALDSVLEAIKAEQSAVTRVEYQYYNGDGNLIYTIVIK